MKVLPKSITPCPIIESLIEIRFKSNLHPTILLGKIMDVLALSDSNIESTGLNEIPESVREKDPNLKYKPLYKIKQEGFLIQFGRDVFTVNSVPEYAGWDRFSKKVFSTYEKIFSENIITEVERLGIRYINFFEENIFNNIKVELSVSGENISNNNSYLRTKIDKDKFSSLLQIANNAESAGKFGSIIDIDTFVIKDLDHFKSDYISVVNEAHNIEKELFFKVLNDSFLATLNPKY